MFICLLLAFVCPSPIVDDAQHHLASFERVWSIINDKHWDLKGTGVDWKAVHETYLPRAQKAKTRDDMRKVMRDMIHELGQTHFGILGAERYEELDNLKAGMPWGTGDPGFKVRVVDGRVFVVSTRHQSPAAKHVPVGSEIVRFSEKDMREAVKTAEKAFEDAQQKSLYLNLTLNDLFSGPEGDSFDLLIRAPGTESDQVVTVGWVKSLGQVEHLGNLPPVSFEYESKVIDQNIGYVAFNIWLMPLIQRFPQSLKEFGDTRGMIIDLRGNSGGIGFLANSIAGYMVSERGKKLGTMNSLDSQINFFINPRAPQEQFDRPIAVLIDGGSASTSEIFAAGMSDLGRVRLVGSRTAGAALPSVVESLPNGDRFQYAIADYISAGGLKIEGHGVEPDLAAPHTLESLGHGHDAALKAATQWILQQGDNP